MITYGLRLYASHYGSFYILIAEIASALSFILSCNPGSSPPAIQYIRSYVV